MHDPAAFAARWAADWNRRDVEAVLAHFHEDVRFVSPTAQAVTGNALVRGKQALRDYWNAALARVSSLEFVVDRVLWDPVRGELAIIHTQVVNGTAKQVSENLTFDGEGKVVSAEVFQGAASR